MDPSSLTWNASHKIETPAENIKTIRTEHRVTSIHERFLMKTVAAVPGFLNNGSFCSCLKNSLPSAGVFLARTFLRAVLRPPDTERITGLGPGAAVLPVVLMNGDTGRGGCMV